MNKPASDGSWRHRLGSARFPVEPERYHLIVGLFCPFAHRVIITREAKGLQSILPMDVVKPYPKEGGGWRFPVSNDEYIGSTVDSLFRSKFLHELYFMTYAEYSGKYSVPVLWDKRTNQIVNNESEDIMRMLNHAFDDLLPPASPLRAIDFYPPNLRIQIEAVSAWLMPGLNYGVYKAGFANTQEEYEKNCRVVFQTLDLVEGLLGEGQRMFLLDTREPTEVDIKLFTTAFRFDVVYQQHFKLMVRSIRHGYPRLNRWLKNFYWNVPGTSSTTDFRHIKENYTKSHADINPEGITPLGPEPSVEPWTEEDEKWRNEILGRG